MKQPHELKEREERSADIIKMLLADVPFIRVCDVEIEARLRGKLKVDAEIGAKHHLPGQYCADLVVTVDAGGSRHQLVCEIKRLGQPRAAREAAAQLRYYCDHLGPSAYGVFMAPYISEASQQICREYGVGYADFAGNCRLVFDHVFIEKAARTKPDVEQRELRSVFAPKSAQVLRVLLRDPKRHWKVTELAEAADVSLGHVSNVRSALIEREWAAAGSEGLHLTNPDALLDGWRDTYRKSPGTRQPFYTTLHGPKLRESVRGLFQTPHPEAKIMLASFSAAEWLAPYARTPTEYFYANAHGVDLLRSSLDLASAAKGENVLVMELEDEGLFRDAVNPAPGIICTSPVQTYLDLGIAGSRGREAAEHLRAERLRWQR